ncbi:MAG TPA: hypothetical protein PLS49_00400 [Candidatus Woesebacteria bacterium]|nr:hypothetical protein [Candidatus Woesebacteria bacterium]
MYKVIYVLGFVIGWIFQQAFGITEENIQDTILLTLRYEPYHLDELETNVQARFFKKINSFDFELSLQTLTFENMIEQDKKGIYKLTTKGEQYLEQLMEH